MIEDTSPQIAVADGNSASWPEHHLTKSAAVFGQRLLSLGAAIEIIKNCLGQPLRSNLPQIFNVDDFCRVQYAIHGSVL